MPSGRSAKMARFVVERQGEGRQRQRAWIALRDEPYRGGVFGEGMKGGKFECSYGGALTERLGEYCTSDLTLAGNQGGICRSIGLGHVLEG